MHYFLGVCCGKLHSFLYIEFTADYEGIIQKNLIQWLLERNNHGDVNGLI